MMRAEQNYNHTPCPILFTVENYSSCVVFDDSHAVFCHSCSSPPAALSPPLLLWPFLVERMQQLHTAIVLLNMVKRLDMYHHY